MDEIWYRLFGMNGSEIYHNFHGRTGDDGAGLVSAGAKLIKVSDRYKERTTSITELTTTMENAWQGGAAGAAQRGAGPLAVEHGLAQGGMTTASTALDSQVSAFNTAKGKVTQIPPTPDKPGLWDNVSSFGGAGRNYETKMNQVNTANDQNVAAMAEYEATTSSNTSSMPTTYGRITDDYSAVGVERPAAPPPSQPYNPVIPGTNNPGNRNTSSSSTGTTPGTSTGPGGRTNPSGSTGNPPGSTTNPGNSQTNPSTNRPPVGLPPRGTLPPGQNLGQGNNPALPGMLPPAAFGPNSGGGGFGPRGSGGGFGPGGSGSGGAGGPGAGGRGPGSGGFGPGAGGAAAAEGAAARGGMGPGGRGGPGGMGGGMGGHGNKGQGEDDSEHERPSFLVEPDPHETFGTDEVTAPPVIGE